MAAALILEDISNISDADCSTSMVRFNANKVILIVTVRIQKIMVKLHLYGILKLELYQHPFLIRH